MTAEMENNRKLERWENPQKQKKNIKMWQSNIQKKEKTKAGNPIEFNTISKNGRTGISKVEEDYWVSSVFGWKDTYQSTLPWILQLWSPGIKDHIKCPKRENRSQGWEIKMASHFTTQHER